MDDITPNATPPRVPPVEPDLLGSAIFLFSEYLQRIADLEVPPGDGEDGEAVDEDEEESPINMRDVLDLFAEELGTSVPLTLNLDSPSVATSIDLVPHTARRRAVEVALSNSFGFGGTNASLIFRKLAQ